MHIGFIGLGRMGGPMCERLLAAGHDLRVHDVRPEAVQPLVERGARPAASATECAAGAEVLITMLPSARTPLRYSRVKMELRAKDYGSQKNPPDLAMTPEQWIAEEKLMPGALQGYIYLEDGAP